MLKNLTLLLVAVGLFGADVRLGTWKYDAKKSKTTSTNPIQTQIDVREALPDGRVQISRSGSYADGTAFKYVFAYKYDGKEYKVKGAPFSMIAVKRIDNNTTSFEASVEPSKAGSKYKMRGQTVVSANAQMMTQTSRGTDAGGEDGGEYGRVHPSVVLCSCIVHLEFTIQGYDHIQLQRCIERWK